MKMTLRQLEAFREVAAAHHFGRAAERLERAQPTVSKEIRLLESALHVQLFHRSAGGTHLTAEGEALLPHAEQALAHVEQLSAHARPLSAGVPARVRVAATPSIVNRLMPEVLRLLETTHPELEVTVLEVDTGGIPGAVQSRKADVGFGHHVRPVQGCTLSTIGDNELYAVLREDLAPDAGTGLDLADLEDLPLLLWPREHNPDYHDSLLAACRQRGLDPLILTGSSRISGARSYLLRDGRAFALVPKDFALTEQAPLRAIPLSEPATISFECLWRSPPSPGTREIVTAMTQRWSRSG